NGNRACASRGDDLVAPGNPQNNRVNCFLRPGEPKGERRGCEQRKRGNHRLFSILRPPDRNSGQQEVQTAEPNIARGSPRLEGEAMAKVTIVQRTQRSLRLILGMRLPRVAEALAPFGYSHEVIDEGWRLMRAITDVQVTRSEAAGETAPAFASSSELEEFASLWFPLARAALGRRFAAQERLLFHGLFEARGQRAAVSVLVF